FGQVFGWIAETVAQAAHAQQVPGFGRRRFELPPQIENMVVDNPIRDRNSLSPYLVDQLVAAQKPAARLDERGQHLELQRGEVDLRAGAACQASLKIHFDLSEAANLRLLRGCSPKNGFDARAEFQRTERLGHIVVRAQLQSQDLFRLLGARREENNRRLHAG